MNRSSLLLRTCMTIALIALLASLSFAQNRERFGISARAGGVNTVVGRVLVKRAGEKSQQDLTDKDELVSGDVVTTDTGSRVEVLLNPGSYLRVTERSQFELSDNSLDHLSVKLIKGSAIVEATGTDRIRLQIGIVTDQSRLVIVRRGVYRFNIAPRTTELLVQKGRVLLEGQTVVFKGGTKVTFTGGTWSTAKLSKSDRDEFDAWSRTRADFLAQANAMLSLRTVNGYLGRRGWSFINGFGLWAWSPFAGAFTFFPFGYGWASPYGNSYGHCGFVSYYTGGGTIIPRPIIVSNPPAESFGGFRGGGSSAGSSSSGSSSGGRPAESFGGFSGGSSGGSSVSPPPPPPSPPARESGGAGPGRVKDP